MVSTKETVRPHRATERPVTEDEPTGEVKASATGLPWPDPSRPIVNQQPGAFGGGFGQAPQPHHYPRVEVPAAPPQQWLTITAALVLIAAILVVVWLVWWR